ncbi:hypothetical protein [Paractinoplanes globisporus]|uniref:DUF4190 domain-containing protein n=1 Tax=Paractinoplanes globisporus TaxID=113565 RepID=A0ABW6WKB6_9ACTN|nr:hypothetical protein [Actinoplanes globisporus]
MRIPTFSRQTEPETAEAERPAAASPATATDNRTTPVLPRRDDEPTTTELRRTPPPPPPPSTVSRPVFPKDDTDTDTDTDTAVRPPVAAGPKPRASMLATFGLILGVAAVLLVLSGPLLGWGIGVAGLALILSLSGIHATGKRHVAGKSDALLGMVLALGAIVLGVLALTGSLSWLGTDTNSVSTFREWLDAHTVNHF